MKNAPSFSHRAFLTDSESHDSSLSVVGWYARGYTYGESEKREYDASCTFTVNGETITLCDDENAISRAITELQAYLRAVRHVRAWREAAPRPR